MAEAPTTTAPNSIPVQDLRRCHAEYDSHELLVNTALYEGGKAFESVKNDLLRWREFEKSNLPGGTALRKARLAAAQYEPVLAGIFDYFSSATLTEPLRISVGESATDEQRKAYDALNKGLQSLAQTRLINANIHKRAYIAIQFPTQPDVVPDMGAQREAGLLQPTLCAVDAPDVQDWQRGENGELEWARIYRTSFVQPSPFHAPTHLRHCWEFWTKTEIVEYRLDKEIGPDGKPKDIDEKDVATRIEARPHKLGAVPLVEVVLPVYVIDRLKSIAISLFNRGASMEYSLDASAYQQGYVKTTSKDFKQMIVAESTFVRLDPSQQEDMGFAGPDTQHLVQLAADCERLDRNMYKAIQAGALRVTTSDGNTSRMSGISRMHEHGSIAVLLAAYGVALLEAFGKAVDLVKKARNESKLIVEVTGCDRFDLLDTEKDLEAVKSLFGFGDWFPASARAWVMSKLLESFCYDAPQDVRQKISKELVAARNAPATEDKKQPEQKEASGENKEPDDATAGEYR